MVYGSMANYGVRGYGKLGQTMADNGAAREHVSLLIERRVRSTYVFLNSSVNRALLRALFVASWQRDKKPIVCKQAVCNESRCLVYCFTVYL